MISLDLIVGVITYDTPNITPAELHGPTPLPPYLSDQAVRPVIDSPLYGSQNLWESLELSGLSLRSIRLLESLRTITEDVVAGAQPAHDYESPTDAQHANLHGGNLDSEEIHSSKMDSVVLLTTTIYFRALGHHPVSFSSPLSKAQQDYRIWQFNEDFTTIIGAVSPGSSPGYSSRGLQHRYIYQSEPFLSCFWPRRT
jgi:hypothetical protein